MYASLFTRKVRTVLMKSYAHNNLYILIIIAFQKIKCTTTKLQWRFQDLTLRGRYFVNGGVANV